MNIRKLRRTGVVGLLAAVLAGGSISGAAAAEPANERRSHHGTIDGAEFRAEVPEDWNGTLVLYSHGYYIEEFTPPGVALSVLPKTEEWLLEHGYALAASNFENPYGYAVKDAQRDQIALLDWFDENVGRPDRTVATGMSQGAAIATVLAERNPHRFDGVATNCGEFDTPGSWNTALDIAFAVKTLLAPNADIDLVEPDDPQGSTDRLVAAAQQARETPKGRARLALAGALGNIPGWYSAHDPEPTDWTERLAQQASWVESAYLWGLGPVGRVDLEQRTGGNPSWNVGVDYDRQFDRSALRGLTLRAYRDAGLDIRRDLKRLAEAPRISPDPRAVAHMFRYGLARGYTPAPAITMHNTGDGGAIPDQERWYADQVDRYGDPRELRQTYVDRGMHCAFSAAEEITQLRVLLDRIETGRWPNTRPHALNAAADALGTEYQDVLDIVDPEGEMRPAPAAFTKFTPPEFLRPSR